MNPLTRVDHLIYLTPNLQDGCDRIEELTGVRPSPGGRHPAYGTHNALLGLGDTSYLEIMAPDPTLAIPEDGVLFDEQMQTLPRLVRWVLRSRNIDIEAGRVTDCGISLGTIASGQREQPDGSTLTWRLTDPRMMPFQGAIPFLIDWGDTPHPAATISAHCKLVNLKIGHPRPHDVAKVLNRLDVKLIVELAATFRLTATMETPIGKIELA